MLETLLEIIHVLVALFMILVVLVQGGNQGGIGAAFGGGNSSGVFGAQGATSFLGKMTYGAAGIFMVTSIWLTILQGRAGDIGLSERLKAGTTSTAPATPTPGATPATNAAPAPATPAPAAATPAPTENAAPAAATPAPTENSAAPAPQTAPAPEATPVTP